MEISEFRRSIPSFRSDDALEEKSEADAETPATAEAAAVEGTVEKDDDNVTYDINDEELDDIEDVYDVMDNILEGLLNGTVRMPITLVKEFEVAMGDLHTFINAFREFKPQEAGVPCIAATLEDEYRETGEPSGDLHLPQSTK